MSVAAKEIEAPSTAAQSAPAQSAPAPPRSLYAEIRGLAVPGTTRQDLYVKALSVIAGHLGADYAAMSLDLAGGSVERTFAREPRFEQEYQTLAAALLLSVRYAGTPSARLILGEGAAEARAVVAVPIIESRNRPSGAVALVVSITDPGMAAVRMAELDGAAAVLATLASLPSAPSGRTATSDGADVSKAGRFQTSVELAFSIANGLKSKLGCEQVSFGRVIGHRVRVLCISGLDNVYPRTPGTRLLEGVMEECLDARAIVCCQGEESKPERQVSSGHLLHERWHHTAGNVAVASLPLLVGERCVAIVSLRFTSGKRLDREELEKLQAAVSPFASGLELLAIAERNLLRHSLDAARHAARNVFRPRTWQRRASLAAGLLLVGWLAFGSKPFVVTVPCNIMACNVRYIAAPFSGTIRACHAAPGSDVRAGDLLFELDTKELNLERQRLQGEARTLEIERDKHLVAREHGLAAQAQSRIAAAQAELAQVNQRIEQAQVRAPLDGTVLLGDMEQRIGQVVQLGDPLLEFAPLGGWNLEIQAPEFAATHLRPGQVGTFVASARPDHEYPCEVEQVRSAAETVNGRNVFVVRASVEGNPSGVRAGMTGYASIDAGIQPVWWVEFHRIIDWLRLQWWKI